MSETPNRLELIEALAIRNTEAIAALTVKVDHLTDNVNDLTNNVDRVLSRSAVLDDVLLELRDSHEQHLQNFEQHQINFERHQQNFNEHQQTTTAPLNSLEAILLQLIRIFPQS
jgi:predicted  nucleic acid-binding Zn-ribbon protein